MTHARPHLETHARSKGHSAIAGVAYRLGLRLQDKRTGEWHDYRKRALGEDIVAAFTLAPAGAPEWATDPARVWDAVETAERRKDSQVAHDFRIPIPFGLSNNDAEAMARAMARHIVVDLQTVVSVGLHRDSPVDLLGQPKPFGKVGYHAHLYFPTRALQFDAAAIREADGEGGAGGSDGWAFGDKLKVLSQKKSAAAVIEEMNRQWAALANHHVHAQGGVPDFTHLSYKRLGLAKLPQLRLGPAATAIERQGIRTRKGDALRAAMAAGDVCALVMDASSAVSSPSVASPLAAQGSVPPPPVVADTAVSVAPQTPADWLRPLDPIVVRAHASTTSVPTTAPSPANVSGLAGRFLAELAAKPELPQPTAEQQSRLVEWLERIEQALRSLAALALRLADLRERRQRDDTARATFLVEGDAARQRRADARDAVAAWTRDHAWRLRVTATLNRSRQPAELVHLQGRVSSLNAQLSQFERGATEAAQRVAMFDARIRTDEAAQAKAHETLGAAVEAVHGMQPLYGMVLLSVAEPEQVPRLSHAMPEAHAGSMPEERVGAFLKAEQPSMVLKPSGCAADPLRLTGHRRATDSCLPAADLRRRRSAHNLKGIVLPRRFSFDGEPRMRDINRKGKPTQPGNPHQLTLNQHVLPKASIDRFTGADGSVECCLLPQNVSRRLRPDNPLFCAKRVWDQAAEAGATTRQVEGRFQELAQKIESGEITALDAESSLIVTQFFALVIVREQLRDEWPDDVVMPGRNGHDLSDDEREELEKIGVMHLGSGGILESRMAAGVHIQGQIVWATRNLGHWQWGIVHSPSLQFVVPDTIRGLVFVPIGPKLLLRANCPNGQMTTQEVQGHNSRARALAKRYYFAKNLGKT